jgi:uncharacterized protein YndB with AHSA1/START domain
MTNVSTDTHREIGRRRIAAGDARTVVIRRRYDAPVEDVWAACTTPARVGRWFAPVTGDLRHGGTFQLENNAHGDILRCEPPRLLHLTWVYGDRPTEEVWARLSPAGDGDTVLEIEHATVATTVEWEGQEMDALLGLGPGWEPAMTYALTALLRGEMPSTPPDTAAIEAAIAESTAAWAALIEKSRG